MVYWWNLEHVVSLCNQCRQTSNTCLHVATRDYHCLLPCKQSMHKFSCWRMLSLSHADSNLLLHVYLVIHKRLAFSFLSVSISVCTCMYESIWEKNLKVVHSAGGQMNVKLAMYTTSSENQSLEEFSSGQKWLITLLSAYIGIEAIQKCRGHIVRKVLT